MERKQFANNWDLRLVRVESSMNAAGSEDYILLITSREKDWWWSLEEVIPAIERIWTKIGRCGIESVCSLSAPFERESTQCLFDSSARIKRIVLTVTTAQTVELAMRLRVQMKCTAPMIIYVTGDSTEGFHAFGALAECLNEQDILVVTSTAEGNSTRYCFPDGDVRVIPFPLMDQFKLSNKETINRSEAPRLSYVGRISEQKNLHVLLCALWIIRYFLRASCSFTLDVFGSVDNLGSPNMGLKFPNYDVYLQSLMELLGLQDVVKWHGYKPRDWLFDNVHLRPHILVSPSLHSDENFGTSLLASLANGQRVVATGWGGHLGFTKWFSRQLRLVPVQRSPRGPFVDPVLFAQALLESMKDTSVVVPQESIDCGRADYTDEQVMNQTLDLLAPRDSCSAPLKKSSLLEHLDRQRIRFGDARRIYADYEDNAAQIFFQAYGMTQPLDFDDKNTYFILPWVHVAEGLLQIDDPHRGPKCFVFDPSEAESVQALMAPGMKRKHVPMRLLKNLVELGYAFPVPRKDRFEREESRLSRNELGPGDASGWNS